MPPTYLYHPFWFYLITISIALALGPIAALFSRRPSLQRFLLPLLLFALCVPCITALAMIYASPSGILILDFWHRLLIFDISPSLLLMILFLMPCTVLIATGLSLLLGYSTAQFKLSHELTVMKGWAILGIIIPLVLAPIIEELGWRGYGVDSLRAYYNLFTTSVVFGVLWAVWHLPAFFIKGYYQNQLWQLGIGYVINFFVSVFVVAFLMNWIYYKAGRSIPAVILFHSVLNLSSMALDTHPFTKCLATGLLCLVSGVVMVFDWGFFMLGTL